MSLVVLLATFLIALVFSNVVDGIPSLLGGWTHLPNWLMWGAILAFVAWCMDGNETSI